MTATSQSYARRALRAYERKLEALYEAACIETSDGIVVGQKWWVHFLPYILHPEWWTWRFDDRGDARYEGRGPFQRFHRFALARWIGRLICRWQSHPSGPVFYNPDGYEPDGRCKDCGQEIA